jgi:hypothetical protein
VPGGASSALSEPKCRNPMWAVSMSLAEQENAYGRAVRSPEF